MIENKGKERKKIPVLSEMSELTDKAVRKIESSTQFNYGCTWSILMVAGYIALFAVVLFFLNKDLAETTHAMSHGNLKDVLAGFFTVMLPVVLLNIAVIVLGLLMFVPVGKIAATFVITAPSFGLKRTWPAWTAMVVIAGGIVLSYMIHARQKPVIVWEYTETDGAIRSTPVVDGDGNIYYVSDDNHLYALNARGLRRWRIPLGERIEASPAIGADGTIFFGTRDSVYALNSYGDFKWAFPVKGELASTPAIAADSTVFFLCNSGFQSGEADPFTYDFTIVFKKPIVFLYALSSSGKLKWEYQVDGQSHCSPAISRDGSIYFATSKGHVYALSSHGELKWAFPEQPLDDEVHSGLAIDESGNIYFGSDDSFLYVVTADGKLKWLYEANDKIQSSPVIGTDGAVYFGSNDKYFYALSPVGDSSREPKWVYKTGGKILSSPSIGSDGLIYFGSNDHHLYGITPEGKVKFDEIVGGKIQSTPLITGDGLIYVGSNNSSFYAIRTSSRNAGLANSPWPTSGANNQNTSRLQ